MNKYDDLPSIRASNRDGLQVKFYQSNIQGIRRMSTVTVLCSFLGETYF